MQPRYQPCTKTNRHQQQPAHCSKRQPDTLGEAFAKEPNSVKVILRTAGRCQQMPADASRCQQAKRNGRWPGGSVLGTRFPQNKSNHPQISHLQPCAQQGPYVWHALGFNMKTDLKVLPRHTQGFWRFYLADRMAERLCGHSYIHIRKTRVCIYIYI